MARVLRGTQKAVSIKSEPAGQAVRKGHTEKWHPGWPPERACLPARRETGKVQEQRRPGLGIGWGRVYLFMNTSTDICRPGGGGAFWANECLLIKASPDANTEKHPGSWLAHGFQDKGGHGRARPLRNEPLPWLGLRRPGWIKFQCQQ